MAQCSCGSSSSISGVLCLNCGGNLSQDPFGPYPDPSHFKYVNDEDFLKSYKSVLQKIASKNKDLEELISVKLSKNVDRKKLLLALSEKGDLEKLLSALLEKIKPGKLLSTLLEIYNHEKLLLALSEKGDPEKLLLALSEIENPEPVIIPEKLLSALSEKDNLNKLHSELSKKKYINKLRFVPNPSFWDDMGYKILLGLTILIFTYGIILLLTGNTVFSVSTREVLSIANPR